MKIIIKGAIYSDGEMLLRPHYSGYFSVVDCTEYKKKEQIKEEYSKATAKEMLSNLCLTFRDEEYFECEYSPFNTDDMELLSDLGEIDFFDEETEF
jgi:hypothetical protein